MYKIEYQHRHAQWEFWADISVDVSADVYIQEDVYLAYILSFNQLCANNKIKGVY